MQVAGGIFYVAWYNIRKPNKEQKPFHTGQEKGKAHEHTKFKQVHKTKHAGLRRVVVAVWHVANIKGLPTALPVTHP